jgi:hypothetical protein
MMFPSLIHIRLGPYKLAYVLNKCLDRFEHPDENVQRDSSPKYSSTIDLTQPSSWSPGVEELGTLSSPPNVSSMPTTSTPLQEMPPLLNQPHWQETDKPKTASSSSPDTSDDLTLAADRPAFREHALPIRPKLTIPRSATATSRILITDDNAINRRVSFTVPAY